MLTNADVVALAKQIDLSTSSEDIVEANFDALYEYYTTPDSTDKNLMPYGTAKARDGDPYQWISEELEMVSFNN